jgi:hypothetical protein
MLLAAKKSSQELVIKPLAVLLGAELPQSSQQRQMRQHVQQRQTLARPWLGRVRRRQFGEAAKDRREMPYLRGVLPRFSQELRLHTIDVGEDA